MRRYLLAMTAALTLLISLAGSTGAQGDPAEPSPTTSPIEMEEAAAEHLPVADYWGEWTLHKHASRKRVEMGVANVNTASPKRKREFLRRLVEIHSDELEWLDNHQSEACYAGEFEEWRVAVQELHSIHKDAVRVAQKGRASGLKRIARQRRAATKHLDHALASVADCVDSVAATLVGEPLTGKWTARPLYLNKGDSLDRNPRRLSISESGRMLLRIPRHPFCRESGHGQAMLSIQAKGETVRDDVPGFAWTRTRMDCHPKGSAKVKIVGPGPSVTLLAYDQAADVLLMGSGAECYWRNRGGSPKDCTAFWRGTPTAGDGAEPDRPAVPDLVGLDAAAAAQALDESGLIAAPRDVFSDSVPAGEVVSQGLAPGTSVDAGRTVTYLVSRGPE